MGGSKSSSTSTTTTNTKTEQKTENYDQRVAATGGGIAIGQGGTYEFKQEIPEEVGLIAQNLIDTSRGIVNQALTISNQAQAANKAQFDSTQQIVVLGLGGIIVLAFILRGAK